MIIDRVTYGVTHQVTLPDTTDMWVKYEASAEIMAAEDPESVSKQLARHVHNALEQRVMEAVEHASRIGAE